MHISSSIIALLGVAMVFVSETFASSNIHQTASVGSVSSYNHLSPSKSIMQIHTGDIQPVEYLQRRRLYNNHRSVSSKLTHRKKRSARLFKRDYATTLQFLRAAMDSYKKDYVTPPPVQLMQLEQQLPPPPPPPSVVAPAPVPASVIAPEALPASETPPPDLESANPPLPDLTAGETEPAPPVELGNETTESAAAAKPADIEEDDTFDPEEDPDDVDDPPVVNGVAVEREE